MQKFGKTAKIWKILARTKKSSLPSKGNALRVVQKVPAQETREKRKVKRSAKSRITSNPELVQDNTRGGTSIPSIGERVQEEIHEEELELSSSCSGFSGFPSYEISHINSNESVVENYRSMPGGGQPEDFIALEREGREKSQENQNRDGRETIAEEVGGTHVSSQIRSLPR